MKPILTPAYGRDYTTKEEVLKDWNDGKDFKAHTPRGVTYTNRSDLAHLFPPDDYILRYNKNRRVTLVSTHLE